MKTSLRHKLTILALAVYFPLLLTLTHIPIPDVVRRAGVSDKGLHFIAFMILSFLAWFAFNPNTKVRIGYLSTWIILLATSLYAAADEISQKFIEERSFDMLDLAANIGGILTGILLAGIFPFWRCLLSVAAITIFTLENLCKTDISELTPLTNITFHFSGYLVLTLIWDYVFKTARIFSGSKAILFSAPPVYLAIVFAAQIILQRPYNSMDIVLSIAGVCTGFIGGRFIPFENRSLEK
jgi:VanZ family protein